MNARYFYRLIKTRLPFSQRHTHPQTLYTEMPLCSCDLDLDLMTLIYSLGLDIVHTKNELSRPRLSKARALQTVRHRELLKLKYLLTVE